MFKDNQDYDVETQLYWLSSRYYSPELCRFISPDDVEYLDPESVNGLNLYCYCMNNPIMYVDPTGHFAIFSFLISIAIGAAISIAMEAIEDGKDGQFFNDKDFWDYFGAGVGGAISGMAGNAAADILLGGVASMVETAISGEATTYNMMSSFLTGAIGGLIGFGIGEIAKYGASLAEAGIGKVVAKFTSNNTVNRLFTKMGATTTKIGMKSIRKIASGLAAAEKNYFAVTISSLASGWF
ncbi:MAG: RHS repeat-associated core domain-containing protein [Bacilli bacterium]